jgi:hypothetical protein
MSVAPETLHESQTMVESPNFKSSTSSILLLLQSLTSSRFDFFNHSISSIFDFFNIRLYIFSTSNAMAKIIGFLNLRSRWE